MLDGLYKLLVIATLGFAMFFAYDSYVYPPGKEINLKKDLVLGIIFVLLIFLTAYVYKLL